MRRYTFEPSGMLPVLRDHPVNSPHVPIERVTVRTVLQSKISDTCVLDLFAAEKAERLQSMSTA